MDDSFRILHNREQYELDLCEQNIALFTKYIQDYECLKNRLATLADKTHHDIMIPIGGTKLAFMPGYIHHTNEILVLLGDNYFVEKSTKEAISFMDRRIRFCCEKLKDLEKQKLMLCEWLGATETLKEETDKFVDITETCTEEEFQQWMKQHNEKIRQQSRMKSEPSNATNSQVDLDKIFAKYEKEEHYKNKAENNIKDNLQFFQSEVIEKVDPQLVENKKSLPSNTTSQRPISKFKASRNTK